MDRARMRSGVAAVLAAAAVVAVAASCAGPQTEEQAKAQAKYGSAAREPTQVRPPEVPVNPPPQIIRPGGPSGPAPGASAAPAPPERVATTSVQVAQEPPPPVAAPPAAQQGESYRPPWWITQPSRSAGRISIAASADGDSLMEARSRVVGAGMAGLRSSLGGQEPRNAQTLKTGIIRLDAGGGGDGKYRAFILMAADER